MIALPEGFSAAGIACGLKASGKLDLGILASDRPAAAAGVFTTNRYAAAPIALGRKIVKRGRARAIVVNSGNANACTGPDGLADSRAMTRKAASALGLDPTDVIVSSTGVIGQRMDIPTIATGIDMAAAALRADGTAFSEAIMTTDTRPKTARARIGDARVVGFAKGAGMMAPEMATMLCYVLTDAHITQPALQRCLDAVVGATFNSLDLDACMSTNDTVIALANGAAGGTAIDGGEREREFTAALRDVCASLAHQIADDGEGMTKLVAIRVRSARDDREARVAAGRVAGSVLLRCALNGADPYWGRVLAALGTAPFRFDPSKVDVWMGGEKLCEGGSFGPGDASKARAALQQREVEIVIDMHRGDGESTVLTNDLSVEYVRFNTEYTT